MRTRIPIEEWAEEPRRARLEAHFKSNRRRRTMTMQTVSLSSLEPGRGNPRKAMDRNGLEGLVASIRKDGVLQNLVVRPVKGRDEHYRVVSGERRYRALKLLEQRGEVGGDYAVPVEIRTSLSKDDSLRIAIVENLQRRI
jgi:ParB family chromosome partitioning protein